MTFFDFLTMIGALCLFLFGMNIMGQALERRAGNSLRNVLSKLTTKKSAGFLTGLGVTAVIQSSSATTVMVVGFVNSGLLALKQAINVIMGANVGTTVTAWLLSLSGIDSKNPIVMLLKPTSFTPILALIGIILYMFCKGSKKNDTGLILLGFATLMFGMDTMSSAVSGLKNIEWFQDLFIMFTNPILGVLAGAILTAIIQSSSASVGILQALSATGRVSYGAAIPIIMGQNIGTCVTAMLSSVGANKNAKRTALVHLSFNIIGTVFWLTVFWILKVIFSPLLLTQSASYMGIAISHSIFNILCTLLLLPMSGLLEKLVIMLVPDAKTVEEEKQLDERLFATPPVALEMARTVSINMAAYAVDSLKNALSSFKKYTPELAQNIKDAEDITDKYEDELGSYLVKLSALKISDSDSNEAAMLLKVIGDFERISDHSVNLLKSVEEMKEKELDFSENALDELNTLFKATEEILDLSFSAFCSGDENAIASIEPLEQVIDSLKEKLRTNHIIRLQQGNCSIEAGFIWSDILTNIERTSDHCSNIAGGLIDFKNHDMNMHETLRAIKNDDETFKEKFKAYSQKYAV